MMHGVCSCLRLSVLVTVVVIGFIVPLVSFVMVIIPLMISLTRYR